MYKAQNAAGAAGASAGAGAGPEAGSEGAGSYDNSKFDKGTADDVQYEVHDDK